MHLANVRIEYLEDRCLLSGFTWTGTRQGYWPAWYNTDTQTPFRVARPSGSDAAYGPYWETSRDPVKSYASDQYDKSFKAEALSDAPPPSTSSPADATRNIVPPPTVFQPAPSKAELPIEIEVSREPASNLDSPEINGLDRPQHNSLIGQYSPVFLGDAGKLGELSTVGNRQSWDPAGENLALALVMTYTEAPTQEQEVEPSPAAFHGGGLSLQLSLPGESLAAGYLQLDVEALEQSMQRFFEGLESLGQGLGSQGLIGQITPWLLGVGMTTGTAYWLACRLKKPVASPGGPFLL
jgi:hypothetical protein